MLIIRIIILYLVVVNVIAYVMMGSDKRKAKTGGWRIPEKRLFGLALIGGSAGVWTGMYIYRHKTQHLSFRIGIPFLLLVNIVLFAKFIIYVR
ncbi:DUF1294 domain-containing protein [Paenibacillus sp. FJAT-26967]|uniref:DUF1294 domain-containing protein n=1 Tax=Paenibacillus sp. FJAT-26967 TaxID=1729690 RepID=UPI000AB9C5C0